MGALVDTCIFLTAIVLFLFLASTALGQTKSDVQRGVDGVHIIQASPYAPPRMLQLQGVYVNKPDKHGESAICYQYGDNRWLAMYIFRQNGSVQLLGELDLATAGPKYQLAFLPCREGIRVADITVDVIAAINPALVQPSAIQTPADRQKLIDGLNATFKQEKVAGYAEIVGDVLIVHSERVSAIRFHQTITESKFTGMLKRAGVLTYTYTNDADQRYSYDVETGQETKP